MRLLDYLDPKIRDPHSGEVVGWDEDLANAHAVASELIASANYMAFAMRDGAVFSRDHAAQRLAAAAAAAGDSA